MIERILEWYEFLQGSSERRHWIFAYVVVPGLVVSYVVSGLSPVSPFNIVEDGISVAAIRTVDDRSGTIREEQGLILIAESSDIEFSIPWKQPSKFNRVLMSIDSVAYQSNISRLSFDQSGLRAKLPLLGVSEPFVLIAVGGAAEDVLLPGKKISVQSLGLPSRSSIAFALWGVFASMFGIGLSIGMANVPLTEPKEERS